MRIRYTYIIAVVLIGFSLILAYDAATSYMNPYLTVSHVVENSVSYLNQDVQVLGIVSNGTIQYLPSSLTFELRDEESAITVTYVGSTPSNFEENIQVVVIGALVSPESIEASQMLVKCPSKYEGGEASLVTDPVFLAAILLGCAAILGTLGSIILRDRQKSRKTREKQGGQE
ncbi:MAG: cytochrome c maturation protein CcmE [Candidatus Bathyarchaeota archaeon]|nr:MAG: cytochrome c maturation protein CcmE [Candidatus Bathyarchaeota archaeon]